MQAKPSECYRNKIKEGEWTQDAAQEQVMQVFDALAQQLEKPHLLSGFLMNKAAPKGVYLYGPVGRGKTDLMDLFYEAVSVPKQRQHFYAFMNEVHAELKLLQGQPDPLKKVAQALAKRARVFCLDEFFVEDIADAMILAAFLHYLFEVGVVLVTTSNIQPEKLYAEGLKRDRFLPAIELLKKNMQILNLNGKEDYRLQKAWCDERYHALAHDQEAYLQFHFKQFNQNQGLLPLQFELNHHAIVARLRGPKTVWFDFAELCVKPRAAQDYLELTEAYSVVLLGGVPCLKSSDEEAARRLIALVDTFYDRKVLLIIGAAVPLAELYQGERLRFEFERTQSRIIEMSSWS